MYHCHILDHEDAGMMGQFVVVATCGDNAMSAASCKTAAAGKAQLQIKDKTDDGKDRFKWKWNKGEATGTAEFRDPLTGTPEIVFCLYDSAGTRLLLNAVVAPGGTCGGKDCWKATGTKGFKYKDRAGTAGGITLIKLKEGDAGKAQVQVKAKGANIATPVLPLTGDVTAQLLIGDASGTVCFQTVYTTPTKNEADQYKAKGP